MTHLRRPRVRRHRSSQGDQTCLRGGGHQARISDPAAGAVAVGDARSPRRRRAAPDTSCGSNADGPPLFQQGGVRRRRCSVHEPIFSGACPTIDLRAFLRRQRTRQRSTRRTRFRHQRFPVPINRGTSYTQRPACRSQANGGSQRFHGPSHSSSSDRRPVQGDHRFGARRLFFVSPGSVSACSSRCRRRAFSLRSCSFSTVTGSRPRPLGPRGLVSAFSDPSRRAAHAIEATGAMNTTLRGAATPRSVPVPGTSLASSRMLRACTRH